MPKPLYPSRRRGPGRAVQRVKPGDSIRAYMMSHPRGATIGECHRDYTKLRAEDWKMGRIAQIIGAKRDTFTLADVDSLLQDKARSLSPRNIRRQQSFIRRKMREIERALDRKRAPGNATYEGFSSFFHNLVQVGFIAHKIDPATKKRARKEPARADAAAIYADHKAREAGQDVTPQIEPPTVYIVTPLGHSTEDWNNPRKMLR